MQSVQQGTKLLSSQSVCLDSHWLLGSVLLHMSPFSRRWSSVLMAARPRGTVSSLATCPRFCRVCVWVRALLRWFPWCFLEGQWSSSISILCYLPMMCSEASLCWLPPRLCPLLWHRQYQPQVPQSWTLLPTRGKSSQSRAGVWLRFDTHEASSRLTSFARKNCSGCPWHAAPISLAAILQAQSPRKIQRRACCSRQEGSRKIRRSCSISAESCRSGYFIAVHYQFETRIIILVD